MPDTISSRRYGGLDADQRLHQRRERLLGAALELFASAGFASTTIEALCAAAGVTPRHFYEQFPTKEALLRALFDVVVGAAEADVAAAVARAGDEAEAQVVAGLEAFLHSYLDDPRRGRIACIEVVGVSVDLERHRRDALHRFADLVVAQATALGAAEVDRLHALAIVGGTNELVIEWLVDDPGRRPSFDRLVEVLTSVYLAAWRDQGPGGATAR